MAGNLYVVSTPIGNLGDITTRAVDILRHVGMIAAEDTRRTRKLLTHFGIRNRMLSYNEHSPISRMSQLLKQLHDMDVALVTDAGSPSVSDPGCELVRQATQFGFEVVPIPGPSAVTAALSVAGMAADRFQFLGFPPRRRKARVEFFNSLVSVPFTIVLFEAPHRLLSCLQDLLEVFGDREICVCREMTKVHEQTFRGTILGALEHFVTPRGEFVVVVAGSQRPPEALGKEVDTAAVLNGLRASGYTRQESMNHMAAVYGISRREAYRAWITLQDNP